MRRKLFVAFLLLISCASLCAQQADLSWVKFTSAEGRFSVMMPTKPEANTNTQPSQYGPYTVHLFTSKGVGEIFLVGWVDYDPGFKFDTQKELEANRDNFAKGVKATVLGTKPIKLGTNPGIEFTAETEQAFFKSRVYIVGRRPYQLISVRAKSAQESANVAKFFSSFELVSPR